MKIRVDVGRVVLHETTLSRRARTHLHADIVGELSRLISGQPEPRRPAGESHHVARSIAAAVYAQLPSAPQGRRP